MSTIATKRIVGILHPFSETGTEGIYWTIIDNKDDGYEAINTIDSGDYLFVEDNAGMIEWEGYVNMRHDINVEPCPYITGNWQRVCECTVHGLDANVDPETWFQWFVEERPAVLIKRVF
jgi:hypothetical protein